MSAETKTIREWLETLPDGYRERALANTPRPDREAETFKEALDEAFLWHSTSEGYAFWTTVDLFMQGYSSYPPPFPDAPSSPSETESLKQRIAELENALRTLSGDVNHLGHWIPDPCRKLVEAALAGKDSPKVDPQPS